MVPTRHEGVSELELGRGFSQMLLDRERQGEFGNTVGCGANRLSNSQTTSAQAVDSGPDGLAISICYPSVKICFLQENRFIQECCTLRFPLGVECSSRTGSKWGLGCVPQAPHQD